ncbi:MAG: HEAT repeat domain-containing protein [Gemmataceae bacterium]|nr:HEAT repeat domain-containing protein [Gemmataceae bacterium]
MRKGVLWAVGLALLLGGPAAGQPNRTSVMSLVWALDAPRPAERLKAAEQLGFYGTAAKSAVPPLMVLLREDPDNAVANMAAVSLARIGPAALPELVKALEDKQQPVRQRAAWALSKFGPEARAAVPSLLRALRDESARVRALAAQALGGIGGDPEELVPPLYRSFRDADPEARRQAGLALVTLGVPAVKELRKALGEEDAILRRDAANVLAAMGHEAKEVIAYLVPLLKDADEQVRVAAAGALGAMRSEAQTALPALLEMMRDEKVLATQQAAFQALTVIGSDDVAGFMAVLREANDAGRWATPYILKQFGPKAADAVPYLVKSLADREEGKRLAATLALGEIGTVAQSAAPALTKLLQDASPRVRLAAASTLARIDPRREELAEKQFHLALAQADKALSPLADRLRKNRLLLDPNQGARVTPKFGLVNRQALTDQTVQRYFGEIVMLHVSLSAIKPGRGGQAPIDLRVQVGDLLSRLPPEAVPALIQGINLSYTYGLGFC